MPIGLADTPANDNHTGAANNHHDDDHHVDDQQQILQQQQLRELRRRHRKQRKTLTLWQSPIQTTYYFLWECYIYVQKMLKFVMKHWLMTSVLLTLVSSTYISQYLPGPHEHLVKFIVHKSIVATEWIILGILSSVGLGTGLHTFVLYLGPFIAKVTLAATECNSADFATYGKDAFICPAVVTGAAVTFWNILNKVQYEALCWGLGTAIGELPPYFVARAARLSGKKLEDVEESEDDDSDSDEDEDEAEVDVSGSTPEEDDSNADTDVATDGQHGSDEQKKKQDSDSAAKRKTKTVKKTKKPSLTDLIMEKGKGFIDLFMGKRPFLTILLMASIPNPLFDLAGLTCGYSLIPFWTFFGATVLGKSVIKAHLQAISVIMVFSKEHLETIIGMVDKLLPFLHGSASAFFEKERQKFHPDAIRADSSAEGKSVLGRVWDIVLFTMIFIFAVSIINSTAQSRLAEQQQKEEVEFLKRAEQIEME